jgi:NAD(P)-dependent dehydrogenase (short-subunit alcohol dehydrogenase family)
VAFVTGGASGIGRALCAALVAGGARVTVADVNASGARAVAAELDGRGSGSATSVSLDVSDATGFERAVSELHEREGRLDLLFNNAGIGFIGAVEELTLAHWERIIDVNLRGVIHGVRAAYPLMLRQRSGHIVNTASVAGLLPVPLATPYAMTKHAVVGLSLSLRAEARAAGVRVSAICPGVIDTAILDSDGPPDLPRTSFAGRGREMLIHSNRGAAYPPEKLAEDVLHGVRRNRALIVAPARTRAAWLLNRLAPALLERSYAGEVAWARRLTDGGSAR